MKDNKGKGGDGGKAKMDMKVDKQLMEVLPLPRESKK